jgi:ribosomal protein S12 methylthiotransferase accessory factor YcaO
MEDIFNHLTYYYPHVFQQMRGLPAYLPVTTYVQSLASSGIGGGFGANGLRAAYGEFIERSHFYLNIPVAIKAEMGNHNHKQLTQSLCHMIMQLNDTESDSATHQFNLTTVKNVFNDEVAYMPTVMFSLAFFDSADRKFIPFMDSSGAAAHISFENSRRSSLLEFIERQSLVASWMTRQYKYKIDPNVLLKIPRQSRMAEQLLNNGEMHVFDLSVGMPGYVIMILFFSKSTEDYVQYSIGISAGLSPLEALTKALNELWLDYSFLYTSAAIEGKLEKVADGKKYTIRHLEDNNVEKTKKIMAFDLSAAVNMKADDFLKLPQLTVAEAFIHIQAISEQVYLYHHQDRQGDFHYTKITSPDFFLHMSVTEKLNIDNVFFKKFRYDLNDLYRHAIPFP